MILSENNFRNILVELERENTSLKTENISLTNCNDQQKNVVRISVSIRYVYVLS